MQTCEKEIFITNKAGLHARAAAVLVQTTNRFKCEVLLRKGDQSVNAKSIMGVMMLAAIQGTSLMLTAQGEDAEECAQALVELTENKFGEEE